MEVEDNCQVVRPINPRSTAESRSIASAGDMVSQVSCLDLVYFGAYIIEYTSTLVHYHLYPPLISSAHLQEKRRQPSSHTNTPYKNA